MLIHLFLLECDFQIGPVAEVAVAALRLHSLALRILGHVILILGCPLRSQTCRRVLLHFLLASYLVEIDDDDGTRLLFKPHLLLLARDCRSLTIVCSFQSLLVSLHIVRLLLLPQRLLLGTANCRKLYRDSVALMLG